MATCSQSIAAMGSYASLEELLPNTLTPFSVTAVTNKLFKLTCPVVQTAQFSISVSSVPVTLTLTFYRWNGSAATPIGAVNITTPASNVYVDFQEGDYIVCVRSSGGNQSGTLTAQFTEYEQQIRLAAVAHVGETMSVTLADPDRPPVACDEALYFELIDGNLPPGLQMDALGVITGRLPNLDCLDDRTSPSINWYYDENDATIWPWGREWRFQVKVWVDGLKESAYDEEWFCIRVHNNWDFDTERFLETTDFEKVTEVRVVENTRPVLPVRCVPCSTTETEARFVPQPLEKTECEPCKSENISTKVELIPIPVEVASTPPQQFFNWFLENKDVDSGNPNIETFKTNLEASPAFALLMQKIGINDSNEEVIDQREFVFLQNFQNFLQVVTVNLDEPDPESFSAQINTWKNLENQILPTTGTGYAGEMATIELRV